MTGVQTCALPISRGMPGTLFERQEASEDAIHARPVTSQGQKKGFPGISRSRDLGESGMADTRLGKALRDECGKCRASIVVFENPMNVLHAKAARRDIVQSGSGKAKSELSGGLLLQNEQGRRPAGHISWIDFSAGWCEAISAQRLVIPHQGPVPVMG